MLKIKADRMKDLEKFGFIKENCPNGVIYTYIIYKAGNFIEILVMGDNILNIYATCDNFFTSKLDIFYELFANDMVEKVGE